MKTQRILGSLFSCEEKMLEYSVATKNNKIQKTEGDALKA